MEENKEKIETAKVYEGVLRSLILLIIALGTVEKKIFIILTLYFTHIIFYYGNFEIF